MYLHVWRVHKSHTTVVEHTQPYNMHKEHDCSRSIHHAIIFLFQIPNAWQKCTQFYACAWQIDLCVRWASSILQTSAWAIAALIKLCATLMMLSDNQPVVKSMHAFISVIFCLSVKLQKAVNIIILSVHTLNLSWGISLAYRGSNSCPQACMNALCESLMTLHDSRMPCLMHPSI